MEAIDISHDSVVLILKHHMGMRKLSARLVPRLFTVDHERTCVTTSKECFWRCSIAVWMNFSLEWTVLEAVGASGRVATKEIKHKSQRVLSVNTIMPSFLGWKSYRQHRLPPKRKNNQWWNLCYFLIGSPTMQESTWSYSLGILWVGLPHLAPMMRLSLW